MEFEDASRTIAGESRLSDDRSNASVEVLLYELEVLLADGKAAALKLADRFLSRPMTDDVD